MKAKHLCVCVCMGERVSACVRLSGIFSETVCNASDLGYKVDLTISDPCPPRAEETNFSHFSISLFLGKNVTN